MKLKIILPIALLLLFRFPETILQILMLKNITYLLKCLGGIQFQVLLLLH